MEDLICKVKLNGNVFWAQVYDDFSYSEFACNTVVNAGVEDISISYDGDSFLFRTYVKLNFYERDDE